jgi:hypothetical protein
MKTLIDLGFAPEAVILPLPARRFALQPFAAGGHPMSRKTFAEEPFEDVDPADVLGGELRLVAPEQAPKVLQTLRRWLFHVR